MLLHDPLTRIQEMNSGKSPKINWDHARAEQKLRGSKVFIQLEKGELLIHSKLAPVERVKEIITQHRITEESFLKFGENRFYTWIFLYTGKEANPLCLPGEEKLVLLSIVSHKFKSELKTVYVDNFARANEILRPGYEYVSSISEVNKILSERLNPLDDGLIIVDKFNIRIKVRNKNARLLNYVINSKPDDISVRTMAKVVLMGKDIAKRLIALRPDLSGPIGIVSRTYSDVLREVSGAWLASKSSKNRVDFAYVSKTIISEPNLLKLLFDMRSGKVKDTDSLGSYVKPEDIINRLQSEYGGTY